MTDELVDRNKEYAARFHAGGRATEPALRVAVVACMDSRLDVFAALGLRVGDAHVIRNAGGVVTDDVIRSLVLSQRLLGTREVVLVHHTRCGLASATDDELREMLREATGSEPEFAFETFTDVDDSVRRSIRRLHASPFLAEKGGIRGFVFDVDSGALREVEPAG